jgi:ELWxxDGT repeat protein
MGTEMVRDIYEGGIGSFPGSLTRTSDGLYFVATNPAGGRELWRSKGSQTSRVHNIGPGATGSEPEGLAVSNGRLFFQAGDVAHGFEPWSLLLP